MSCIILVMEMFIIFSFTNYPLGAQLGNAKF